MAAAAAAPASLPPLTLTFELHPACRLHVAYFLDVRNAAALKSRMLAGHLRAALLDAAAVCGVRQVRARSAPGDPRNQVLPHAVTTTIDNSPDFLLHLEGLIFALLRYSWPLSPDSFLLISSSDF
jgi:hypothetical protein